MSNTTGRSYAPTAGMSLAEYADLLNRKARDEATPNTGGTSPQGSPPPAPLAPQVAYVQPNPLAGWVFLGLVQTSSGKTIFGELMAPTGVRVTAYPGDALIPGYVVQGINDGSIQVSCPVKSATVPKQGARSRKDTAATTQTCVQTLRRGVPA